tara:strand:- start:300 stop:518 length:219 start_codon:yes stop_codon:yes gene_type:complete
VERIDWELLRSMSEGNNKVDLNDYVLKKWSEVSDKGKFMDYLSDEEKGESCKVWVKDEGMDMIRFIINFIGG